MNKPLLVAAAACSLALFVGSMKGADHTSASDATAAPMKIKVGYIGITCEAPLFMAVEKGFFKEEGLDVSLVKCDWSTYKDTLALGGIDITHHLIMMYLKPIEQGMDVKILAGVHKGCLRVQASTSGAIRTLADLRGKRIGVPGMGTPPFIYANRALAAHGIDPSREITWLVYPAGELGLALERGNVDAVASAEPIGTILTASGNVRNVSDQATEEPFASEYCCGVVANGKFVANNPKAAAAATRAILKGAMWVQANPEAAATLAVQMKYIASKPETNAEALSHLHYLPSVSGGEASVRSAALAMKNVGMLDASTDIEDLTKRAFVHIDGVSDEWIKSVHVETVAGGPLPPNHIALVRIELATSHDKTCGGSCCDVANN